MSKEEIICECFFCQEPKLPHPASHRDWFETSAFLLKAESLDPNDIIRIQACATCGHREEAKD